jgi:hypothetical protein
VNTPSVPAHLPMYQRLIVDAIGCAPSEARHVEAYMRLELGTLDHLSRVEFDQVAAIGFECMKADPEASESLARSFGL